MAADTNRSSSGYGGVTEPCTVILFGASGDLAKRKVIPALYDLAIHNALGPRYALVGFARTAMTDESFRVTCSGAEAFVGHGRAGKTYKGVTRSERVMNGQIVERWYDFAFCEVARRTEKNHRAGFRHTAVA